MSSTSSPLLSTYNSASNLMDDLYNSPPLPIETPTLRSGTGSQISMLNSNPGFFPSAAPSDPGVENWILHLLQGISATQDQQTTILTDHGNDITSIGQIIQNLTTLVHHNATVQGPNSALWPKMIHLQKSPWVVYPVPLHAIQ